MEPLLFETILIKDGKVCNIEYHQKRVYQSRKTLFNLYNKIDLLSYIKNTPTNGEYRCKIIYSDTVYNVEIKPYIYIEKKSFLLIEIDFDYSFKYLDRAIIDDYKEYYSLYDDLIFMKNGAITDTTIANIAIYKNGIWLTPQKPLLRGTTRARLLDSNKLTLSDIKYQDILSSKKFAVMNALSGFRVINHPKFTLLQN